MTTSSVQGSARFSNQRCSRRQSGSARQRTRVAANAADETSAAACATARAQRRPSTCEGLRGDLHIVQFSQLLRRQRWAEISVALANEIHRVRLDFQTQSDGWKGVHAAGARSHRFRQPAIGPADGAPAAASPPEPRPPTLRSAGRSRPPIKHGCAAHRARSLSPSPTPASSSPGKEADISMLPRADILTLGVQLATA